MQLKIYERSKEKTTIVQFFAKFETTACLRGVVPFGNPGSRQTCRQSFENTVEDMYKEGKTMKVFRKYTNEDWYEEGKTMNNYLRLQLFFSHVNSISRS